MGVTGLWTVVQPCARPIKIETLNRKRLAVDASIWVYQFLKAVRDKEGHALRNSHVVGFFRRICKLLFIGILPVFVFDGGAPVLKRQTVAGRKSRREGRREDAVRTAGKLLALQMQRRAEEEDAERKRRVAGSRHEEEEPLPEKLVYVDELGMSEKERQAGRKFKRKDQYHLPDLDVPLSEMGAPNDPRVMSMEELENYARQFDTGEDINVYDFSKIDFDSPFFTSLPASDRYNILNAARLRSRLRMGYSKEQLDKMFPDRMAFSRFQIERVAERNELTARLMNINGMGDDPMFDGSSRVAGEKGREYVLVKNPGVEGGWALGVIGDRDKEEGEQSKPIDIDDIDRRAMEAARDEEDDNAEEEEPAGPSEEEIERRRKAFYESRKDAITTTRRRSDTEEHGHEQEQEQDMTGDQDDLFVGDATETAAFTADAVHSNELSDDDEELQRAIALSLGQDSDGSDDQQLAEPSKFDPSTFKQQRAADYNPFAKQSRGGFAHVANKRARRAAPAPVKDQSDDDDEDDDDNMDFGSALAQTRKTAEQLSQSNTVMSSEKSASGLEPNQKLKSGPLPFEKLDLGSSLLGKKKMQQIQEQQAGGFEKDDDKKNEAAPLPPWFSKDDAVEDDMDAQKAVEDEDRRREREASDERYEREMNRPTLRKQQTNEVIDLDAMDEEKAKVILVDDDEEQDDEVQDDEDEDEILADDADEQEAAGESPSREQRLDSAAPEAKEQAAAMDEDIRMGDVAEKVRGEPPQGPFQDQSDSECDEEGSIEWEQSDNEQKSTQQAETVMESESVSADGDIYKQQDALYAKLSEEDASEEAPQTREEFQEQLKGSTAETNASEEQSDFAEQKSDVPERSIDTSKDPQVISNLSPKDAATDNSVVLDREESPDDVYIPDEDFLAEQSEDMPEEHVPASGVAGHEAPIADFAMDGEDEDEDVYSDPEDEELMLSLANEAEEHARFASTFNNKTQRQNIEEYERELKALRTQQKKDRRDADEVTQVMISECQQLLKMFGLPYITAPMEAEAQCAELVRLGLVDGIVTDDSDTFLFGGTRIYKNMFNQAKFVECYLASDLEKEFDLTRDKLIRIAHLLGSDYTEGLPGIGPVSALEIISEFPEGLVEFRDWWAGVQMGHREAKREQGFRKKFLKSNATKLFLPTAFPDARVDEAYLHPEVDSDPSPFQWGVPDLDALRRFLMATIGWSEERTDEVLVPVIRDMNRRENEGTQSNITTFVTGHAGSGAFAPRVRGEGKSKRMEGALERMAQRAKRKRVGSDDGAGVGGTHETSTKSDGPAGGAGHGGPSAAGRGRPPKKQQQQQQSSRRRDQR